jgi:hypothetical protein
MVFLTNSSTESGREHYLCSTTHYIPQGYLRGFTIPQEKSLVWEYDKESGQISLTPKSIRDMCSEQLYYTQYDESGEMDKQAL